MRYLYVIAGGAAGSLLRYAIGLLVLERYAGSFPLGTFIVNITGSFLIGIAMSHLPAGSPLRPLLVTGFLGGYTTFSSLQWESLFAAQNGLPGIALLNVAGSVVAGYAACWAGAWLSSTLK
jgi:CrcB protein